MTLQSMLRKRFGQESPGTVRRVSAFGFCTTVQPTAGGESGNGTPPHTSASVSIIDNPAAAKTSTSASMRLLPAGKRQLSPQPEQWSRLGMKVSEDNDMYAIRKFQVAGTPNSSPVDQTTSLTGLNSPSYTYARHSDTNLSKSSVTTMMEPCTKGVTTDNPFSLLAGDMRTLINETNVTPYSMFASIDTLKQSSVIGKAKGLNRENVDSNPFSISCMTPPATRRCSLAVEPSSREIPQALLYRDSVSISSQSDQSQNFGKKWSKRKRPPCRVISAEEMMREILVQARKGGTSDDQYQEFFKDIRLSSDTCVTLKYPGHQAHECFPLMCPVNKSTKNIDAPAYDPIIDIYETVLAISQYLMDPKDTQKWLGDTQFGLLRDFERALNRRDARQFIDAVLGFNQVICKGLRKIEPRDTEEDTIRKQRWVEKGERFFWKDPRNERSGLLPFGLAHHIVVQMYSRAIAPSVERLHSYKPFSNNVYGEVKPKLVHELIQRTGIVRDSVFIDLGSGVGNAVLQVATETGCEAWGIEVMDIPADLADVNLREWKARMRYYNVSHGPVKLLKGDFLNCPQTLRVLRYADVIFCNNYAFDQHLNLALQQLFLEVKDSVKIISFHSFVPEDNKVTSRNAESVQAILKVKRFEYHSNCVSWTNSGGCYYIHTIDREPIQKFLYKLRANRQRS